MKYQFEITGKVEIEAKTMEEAETKLANNKVSISDCVVKEIKRQFTPADIIIGQKYRNKIIDKYDCGTIYLGCGKRHEKEKFMVVCNTPRKEEVGFIVKAPEYLKDDFWDNFYEIKN